MLTLIWTEYLDYRERESGMDVIEPSLHPGEVTTPNFALEGKGTSEQESSANGSMPFCIFAGSLAVQWKSALHNYENFSTPNFYWMRAMQLQHTLMFDELAS